MDLLDSYLLDCPSTLNTNCKTASSRYNLKQQIVNLKDNIACISTPFIYALSTKAIPNLVLQKDIANKVTNKKIPLSSLHSPALRWPLILFCLYFALFRHVKDLKSFVVTTCSILSAMRYLIWVPHISDNSICSDILYKFVEASVQGQLPAPAIIYLLKNRDLSKLVPSYETKSFYNSKYFPGKSRYQDYKDQSSKSERKINGAKCNSCGEKVFTTWSFHNSKCSAKSRRADRKF